MQAPNLSEVEHSPIDLHADFCGELEAYAATGEATNALDRLCGKLWNCTDVLSATACRDADLPTGSTYAQAAQAMRRAHSGTLKRAGTVSPRRALAKAGGVVTRESLDFGISELARDGAHARINVVAPLT